MHFEQPPELLPARMINEFVYCPRLFWLEYVEREFEHSYYTVDGERVHRRVDEARGTLSDEIAQAKAEATSVELASEDLGVVAKIDIVRTEEGRATPIDFKRGNVPAIAEGVYDPERVQLCIQGLLLREHGYTCEAGKIYYAASKRFVDVPFSDELVALTLSAIRNARAMMTRGSIPPPLVHSPKCGRCSLNAICLPDEVHLLQSQEHAGDIRPFAAPSDDRTWLYVMEPGARVGMSAETLPGKVGRRRKGGVAADRTRRYFAVRKRADIVASASRGPKPRCARLSPELRRLA